MNRWRIRGTGILALSVLFLLVLGGCGGPDVSRQTVDTSRPRSTTRRSRVRYTYPQVMAPEPNYDGKGGGSMDLPGVQSESAESIWPEPSYPQPVYSEPLYSYPHELRPEIAPISSPYSSNTMLPSQPQPFVAPDLPDPLPAAAPVDVSDRIATGRSFMDEKKYSEAAVVLQQAMNDATDPAQKAEAAGLLGRIRIQDKRYSDAVNAYRIATGSTPDSAEYWFMLGYSQAKLGKQLGSREEYEKALAALEQALILDPTHAKAKEYRDILKNALNGR